MVLLRSGKKTRSDAPKIPVDKNNRPVLDFNAAVNDEEKRATKAASKTRPIHNTPKSAGKKSIQQADEQPRGQKPKGQKPKIEKPNMKKPDVEKPNAEMPKEENPRPTPKKTATAARNETRTQVSARKKRNTVAVGSKVGSSSAGAGPSKSPFLKSGAGEIRRKRLSEEKKQARKLSEGKGPDYKPVMVEVQVTQQNVERDEKEENLALGINSIIVGPTIQISLYHLLNSKQAMGASEMHNVEDEVAVLGSRKNNNRRLKMEFHQIDWSDDENEEWSDSGSEGSYDVDDKSMTFCEVEYRSSLSSTGSPSHQYDDVPTVQAECEEESLRRGSPSSRVPVWWEPDDEVEGGVEVIDGTSTAHAYSREADDGTGVSPSSVSSSASASSWHTATGSVSLSTAFHSTNRRYADGQDDKKTWGL